MSDEIGFESEEDSVSEAEQKILEAFNVAIDDEQSEDDTKMLMIQNGASFKNVTRLYNKFMIDAGLAMSTADRKAAVEEVLSGRDLSTEEGFDDAVYALVEAITGSTERSAASLVRSYAKKEDLDVFTKPKVDGGTRNPFVRVFHDALIENPNMDEQGLRDVIASLEPDHQVNPLRWFNQHNNIRKTANAIAQKLAA